MRKKKMNKSIFVDIDGTIANCEARLHHIKGIGDHDQTYKTDWDAFYEDVHLDKAIQPTLDIVNALSDAGWCTILITGRSDQSRAKTEKWLEDHNVQWNLLLMRATGDHTDDSELKKQWLHDLRNGRISIRGVDAPEIVIEDRARVIKMWREEGLVALQCAEGDF
jgi:hypothetical protein